MPEVVPHGTPMVGWSLPPPQPTVWLDLHYLVTAPLGDHGAAVYGEEEIVPHLQERLVGLAPAGTQRPGEQFVLVILLVLLHVVRQIQSNEKVLLGVLLSGEAGAGKIREGHRQEVLVSVAVTDIPLQKFLNLGKLC